MGSIPIRFPYASAIGPVAHAAQETKEIQRDERNPPPLPRRAWRPASHPS